MAVSAWVAERRFELGAGSFLKAWFSTIFVRLEGESWGSVYPTIMRELYSGRLRFERADIALAELQAIQRRLADHPPAGVVWDFENRNARPPWGDQISGHIVSLANYFVTSDGKDLITVLATALRQATTSRCDVVIS